MAKVFQKYVAHRGKEDYVEYYGEKGYRTIFHHDRAEVSYSRYFRRLAFRQYHIEEPGTENRTRLLHCIEVATIASGMAYRLGLNIDLTEAIAMGHDIAQPPCGYPADNVLKEFLKDQGGFNHGLVGSQILQWGSKKESGSKRFERLITIPCYRRINFSDDVKTVSTISEEAVDGIAKHTPPSSYKKYHKLPLTLEGQTVRIADNLSYISQEIDEGLCLDESYAAKLESYAAKDVLQNEHKGEEKTREQLLNRQPGCPSDERFLTDVFGVRLGPRLIAMIKRVENHNKEMHKMGHLRFLKTKLCKEGRVPKLVYDPVLEFIIDFIWDEFIGKIVNKNQRVQQRIAKNREKIKKALNLRMSKLPIDPLEKENFEERQKEASYFYPRLSKNTSYKRAVAHHVATLTDSEIDKILKA